MKTCRFCGIAVNVGRYELGLIQGEGQIRCELVALNRGDDPAPGNLVITACDGCRRAKRIQQWVQSQMTMVGPKS